MRAYLLLVCGLFYFFAHFRKHLSPTSDNKMETQQEEECPTTTPTGIAFNPEGVIDMQPAEDTATAAAAVAEGAMPMGVELPMPLTAAEASQQALDIVKSLCTGVRERDIAKTVFPHGEDTIEVKMESCAKSAQTQDAHPVPFTNILSHYFVDKVFLAVDTNARLEELLPDKQRIAVAASTSVPHDLFWFYVCDAHGIMLDQADVVFYPLPFHKASALTYNGACAMIGRYFLEGHPTLPGGYRIIDVLQGTIDTAPSLEKDAEIVSAQGVLLDGKPSFVFVDTEKRVIIMDAREPEKLYEVANFQPFDQKINMLRVTPDSPACSAKICLGFSRCVWVLGCYSGATLSIVDFGSELDLLHPTVSYNFPMPKTAECDDYVGRLRSQFEAAQLAKRLSQTLVFEDTYSLDVEAKTVRFLAPNTTNVLEAIYVDPELSWIVVALTRGVVIYEIGKNGKKVNATPLRLNDTVALHHTDPYLIVVHQTGELNVLDMVNNATYTVSRHNDAGPFHFGSYPCQWIFETANGDVAVFSPHGAVRILHNKQRTAASGIIQEGEEKVQMLGVEEEAGEGKVAEVDDETSMVTAL